MAGRNDQALRSAISDLLGKPSVEDSGVDSDVDDLPGEDADQDEPSGDVIGLSDDDLDAAGEDQGGDDEGDNDDNDKAEGKEGESPEEGATPKALAERLGIEASEIYKMRIPVGDSGDTISLGELKDVGVRASTLDAEVETFESDRTEYINEKMKSRNELQNIISLLPSELITPELIQQARTQHAAMVRTERIGLLEALPRWKDPAVESEARTNMLEHLKGYGFNEVEVNNMLDHRLVKLIADFTALKLKVIKPRQEIKARKKKRPGVKQGSRSKGRQTLERAVKIGRGGQNIRGAVDALLNGE